jgi:enamine deaminase RidA (YjgF/YER057c/UK114 family)
MVAGAKLSDIIETRAYVADPNQLAKYADLRKRYFGSASPTRLPLGAATFSLDEVPRPPSPPQRREPVRQCS